MGTLIIDNYDSFTWNLVHLLRGLGDDPVVVRHDEATIDRLISRAHRVLISAGPGTPGHAGQSISVVERCRDEQRPLLGICLGHQCLGVAFGMTLGPAPQPVHGKAESIGHDGTGVFAGSPKRLRVARYHSLALDPATRPDCLRITARTDDGVVMGIRHRTLPLEGLQFHPESFLTDQGSLLLTNFLDRRMTTTPGVVSIGV